MNSAQQYREEHPQYYGGSGQHFGNDIRNCLLPDYVLTLSRHELPPTTNSNYMPMTVNNMFGRTTLAGDGAYIPRSSIQYSSLIASGSPSTFSGGVHHAPSPSVPQVYPQEYTPPPQLIGYAQTMAAMPPPHAPQGWSYLAGPSGGLIGGPEILYGNQVSYQTNNSLNALPQPDERANLTKRKRDNPSPHHSKRRRQNTTTSTRSKTKADNLPKKRNKKPDYSPDYCPYCAQKISRRRRVQNHVRGCKRLAHLILSNQMTITEIRGVISKWGVPIFMKDIEIDFGLEADKGNSSQAGPSYTHSPEGQGPYDTHTVTNDSRALVPTSWFGTHDTSSESSSSSQYSEDSPISTPTVVPSLDAEKQRSSTGLDGSFTTSAVPMTQFGLGTLDWYTFNNPSHLLSDSWASMTSPDLTQFLSSFA